MFPPVFVSFHFPRVLRVAGAPRFVSAFTFVIALASLVPPWGAGASVGATVSIAGGPDSAETMPPGLGGSAPAQPLLSQAGVGQRDEDVLAKHREAAHRGEPAAIEVIVGLAGGSYINSAEGSEGMNALFMELLIAHPATFLSAVARQSDAVRDRVIRELRQPVHDAYFAGDLLAAVRLARREVNAPLVEILERDYDRMRARRVEQHKWLRDDLVAAVDVCLHWGGEEAGDAERAADIRRGHDRDCGKAVAIARERLSISPHDPVVGAVAADLAGYFGGKSANEIFRDENFKRWACAGAAFYHRAMAQYGRYGARSRGYFAEVCPKAAEALPTE